MTMIEAVSQSTRAERKVEVAAAGDGVRVAIRDGKTGNVLAFAVVSADELMTVLAGQPEGPTGIRGDTAGVARVMTVEVRRKEVWLTVGGVDSAVGLDDLMDALVALPT